MPSSADLPRDQLCNPPRSKWLGALKHGGPLGMQQGKRKSDASEAYPRVPYWLEQPQIGYHFAQVGNKQEYNKAKECKDV